METRRMNFLMFLVAVIALTSVLLALSATASLVVAP